MIPLISGAICFAWGVYASKNEFPIVYTLVFSVFLGSLIGEICILLGVA